MNRFIVLTLLSFTALADGNWKPLEGTYAITGEYTSEVGVRSHYRFQLNGEAAKDMYQSLKVKTTIDECTEALSKKIENMQCLYYKSGEVYECHFSINLANQKIEYGVPC